MAETVSVRVPEDELRELNALSKLERRRKSDVLREVLRLGIQNRKLEFALETFRKEEATAAKAAKMAGMSLTKFLEILVDRKIDFHYGLKDLHEDMEGLA